MRALFDGQRGRRPFPRPAGLRERCLAGSMDEARRLAGETGRAAITPDGDRVEGDRVFRLAGRDTQETEILQRELEIPQLTRRGRDRRGGSPPRGAPRMRAWPRRCGSATTRPAPSTDRLSALEEAAGARRRVAHQLRTELGHAGRGAHAGWPASARRWKSRRRNWPRRSRGSRSRWRGPRTTRGARTATSTRWRAQAEEQERLRDERTREASEREMEAVRLRGLREAEEGRRASLEREAGELARALGEATQRLEERSRTAAEETARAAALQRGAGEPGERARDAGARGGCRSRDAHQECQDGIFALDAEVRTARETLDGLVAALHTEEVERLQVHGEAERIRERVLEDHAVDLETYEPKPDPVSRAAAAVGPSRAGGPPDRGRVRRRRTADGRRFATWRSGLDDEALARLDAAAAGADDDGSEADDEAGDDDGAPARAREDAADATAVR